MSQNHRSYLDSKLGPGQRALVRTMQGRQRPPRSPQEDELVEMAKRVVMEDAKCGEPEAYRLIRSTAMHTRTTITQVCSLLLGRWPA